jgi:hypothetical protein
MKPPTVTDALKAFAAALERAGIQPGEVEVLLSLDNWQSLARRLDEERHGEPGEDIGKITVGGVRYLIRYR